MKKILGMVLLVLLALVALPSAARRKVEVKEWTVPFLNALTGTHRDHRRVPAVGRRARGQRDQRRPAASRASR